MTGKYWGCSPPCCKRRSGFNEAQYGYIVTAFQAAYALGLLAMGPIIDRIGTKLGYALSISIWSLSAMGHALVHSALGFGVARFALGLGESGSFPAAIKTVAEWFPKKERALATGLLNCWHQRGGYAGSPHRALGGGALRLALRLPLDRHI